MKAALFLALGALFLFPLACNWSQGTPTSDSQDTEASPALVARYRNSQRALSLNPEDGTTATVTYSFVPPGEEWNSQRYAGRSYPTVEDTSYSWNIDVRRIFVADENMAGYINRYLDEILPGQSVSSRTRFRTESGLQAERVTIRYDDDTYEDFIFQKGRVFIHLCCEARDDTSEYSLRLMRAMRSFEINTAGDTQ